jgi:hypothetical protein
MKSSKKVRAEIRGGHLIVNDVRLHLPCPLQEVEDVFGECSRAIMLANMICVWDHLGIYAHPQVEGLEVTLIGFAFNKYDAEFIPSKFYRGDLLMDGFRFSKKLKAEHFEAAGFEPDAPPDFWSYKSGDGSLQVIISDGVFCCANLENYGPD